MYLKLQLNEVPSVVQIACIFWGRHMKFYNEHVFRPALECYVPKSSANDKPITKTLHTLYAAAQQEKYIGLQKNKTIRGN